MSKVSIKALYLLCVEKSKSLLIFKIGPRMFIVELKGCDGVMNSFKTGTIDVVNDVRRFLYTKNLVINNETGMRFKVYYKNCASRYFYVEYKKVA